MDQNPPGTVRTAASVVALQALALLVVAIALSVLAFIHSTSRLWAALAIIGFAVLGAVVLLVCARGLLGLQPSSRAPVVLLELITLPVGYNLGFQAGRVLIGVPILASALATLILLFTPSARQALNRVL